MSQIILPNSAIQSPRVLPREGGNWQANDSGILLPGIASVSAKLDAIREQNKQGLLDTTGDGLNANVIKLVEAMKSSTSGLTDTVLPQAPSDSATASSPETFMGRLRSLTTLKGWFKPGSSDSVNPIGAWIDKKIAAGDVLAAASKTSGGMSKEEQVEQSRAMEEQTDELRDLTSTSKEILEALKGGGNTVSSGRNTVESSGSEGAGTSGVLETLLSALALKGTGVLGRAKDGIVKAGTFVADKAKTVATTVSSGAKTVATTVSSGAKTVATKAAPVLARAGNVAKGILSKAALPLAAAMATYDGVSGYNKAAENLGIEGREATFGEKMSSAGGSILSGLSFGLLDEKSTSQGIASFFGAGPDATTPAPTTSESKDENVFRVNRETLVPGQKINRKMKQYIEGYKYYNRELPEWVDEMYKAQFPRSQYNKTNQATPVSSTPVSSTPVSSTPVSSTPVSSTPVTSAPTGSVTPIEPMNISRTSTTDENGNIVSSEVRQYQMIANEEVVPGQKLSDKQMTIIGVAKRMGVTYSPEVESQYAAQKASQVTAPTPIVADQVTRATTEVVDATRAEQKAAAQNVVVSAPTTNIQTSNNYVTKPQPRNTESSLQQYNRQRYAM